MALPTLSSVQPPTGPAADIVTYVATTAALEELSEFGAIYWPRVKVLNPAKSVFASAEQLVVPPSGIVAGVFGRTDSAQPGGVYDPHRGGPHVRGACWSLSRAWPVKVVAGEWDNESHENVIESV